MINKGVKRIQEKVKEVRQSFSRAVVEGNRSGHGQIVIEHYDQLVKLWGGSANIKPLEFGVSGEDFNISTPSTIGLSREYFDNSLPSSASTAKISDPSNSSSIFDYDDEEVGHENEVEDASLFIDDTTAYDEQQEINETVKSSQINKRKSSNCVHKLIDKKRKHLEKNLSAAQRDQILIKEAKDDAQFRKDMADAIRESNESFTQGIKDISKSMSDLGAGICRSIEMMSQAMVMQTSNQQHAVNQNMFYQNAPLRQPVPNSFTQMLYDFQNQNELDKS